VLTGYGAVRVNVPLVAPEDTTCRDNDAAEVSSDAIIQALQAENALLRAENSALIGRLADLERHLGLNSSTSGKPPSSDGLKRPPRVSSLRESSGKKTGGQTGHPGAALRRTETPDATIEHYPEACTACGEPLIAAMATGYVARQVFDLPEPTPLIVTKHRATTAAASSAADRRGRRSPNG
jgi:transposase